MEYEARLTILPGGRLHIFVTPTNQTLQPCHHVQYELSWIFGNKLRKQNKKFLEFYFMPQF